MDEYGYDTIASIHNIFGAIKQASPNCLDDADVDPKQEHPIFFGCYDWHSAVHSHYSLLVLIQSCQDAYITNKAIQHMTETFTVGLATMELASLQRKPNTWECPYGLSWYLKLYSLLCSHHPNLATAIGMLFEEVESRLIAWVYTLDSATVDRSGLHRNTAFSLLLILEACEDIPNSYSLRSVALTAAKKLYISDVLQSDGPKHPNGSSPPFLSATLCEAELISHCYAISPDDPYLPDVFHAIPFSVWMVKAVDDSALFCVPDVTGDPSDKGRCHTCGFNLSRASCFAAVARALLPDAVSAYDSKQQQQQQLESSLGNLPLLSSMPAVPSAKTAATRGTSTTTTTTTAGASDACCGSSDCHALVRHTDPIQSPCASRYNAYSTPDNTAVSRAVRSSVHSAARVPSHLLGTTSSTPGTSKLIANAYRESHTPTSKHGNADETADGYTTPQKRIHLDASRSKVARGVMTIQPSPSPPAVVTSTNIRGNSSLLGGFTTAPVPLSTVRFMMLSAIDHFKAGLPYLNSGHFMGDHWLNTFAIRAITGMRNYI
jgi:hypothetical protein